jgi:hypothetical protein
MTSEVIAVIQMSAHTVRIRLKHQENLCTIL